jgi:hypothetical protein
MSDSASRDDSTAPGREGDDPELEVEIKSLMLDPTSSVPIVILRHEESRRILPIWIGVFEASAIASRLDGQSPSRPLTHDLLLNGLQAGGATVEKVVICELLESTFYALIHLALDSPSDKAPSDKPGDEAGQGGPSRTLDARPSDAIALALRAEVPIYVLESVLNKAEAAELVIEESDEERLKKWLEEISPEELGKYTM